MCVRKKTTSLSNKDIRMVWIHALYTHDNWKLRITHGGGGGGCNYQRPHNVGQSAYLTHGDPVFVVHLTHWPVIRLAALLMLGHSVSPAAWLLPACQIEQKVSKKII